MNSTIGEYLHKKAKAKALQDKEVAAFLNISSTTLRKVYLNDEIYVSRLIEFCKLFNEDLFLNFYYEHGVLKELKKKELEPFKTKIKVLEEELDKHKKETQQLEDHIKTQKQLIKHQEEHIRLLQKSKPSKK